MHPLISSNQARLNDLCKSHYVKSLYAFGSVTNEKFDESSDIDLLYKIDTDKFKDWATGGYDYIDNLNDLEKGLCNLFDRKIDLIPDTIIHNRFLKQTIEQSKQLLYEA